MSVFTYTALREFEPTGFNKTGVDISAAAGDDSFNATSTNLSGVLDNQWVLVAGFANAANNGWFQANGNSTSAKITQDTTASLVTEAAGPSVNIAAYYRGLGQSYNLEIGLERVDRSVKVRRNEQHPLGGGAPEVLTYSRGQLVGVRTDYITEAQIKQWREFLASVEGGETFTFDRYGTLAAPVDPRTAELADPDYSEDRLRGQMRYQLSLKIMILS